MKLSLDVALVVGRTDLRCSVQERASKTSIRPSINLRRVTAKLVVNATEQFY